MRVALCLYTSTYLYCRDYILNCFVIMSQKIYLLSLLIPISNWCLSHRRDQVKATYDLWFIENINSKKSTGYNIFHRETSMVKSSQKQHFSKSCKNTVKIRIDYIYMWNLNTYDTNFFSGTVTKFTNKYIHSKFQIWYTRIYRLYLNLENLYKWINKNVCLPSSHSLDSLFTVD